MYGGSEGGQGQDQDGTAHLTPTPWPPSPLRGGEGKGVGGWGEVESNIAELLSLIKSPPDAPHQSAQADLAARKRDFSR